MITRLGDYEIVVCLRSPICPFHVLRSTFHVSRSTFHVRTFARSHVPRSPVPRSPVPRSTFYLTPCERGDKGGAAVNEWRTNKRMRSRSGACVPPPRACSHVRPFHVRTFAHSTFHIQRSPVPHSTFARSPVPRSHVRPFHVRPFARSTFLHRLLLWYCTLRNDRASEKSCIVAVLDAHLTIFYHTVMLGCSREAICALR